MVQPCGPVCGRNLTRWTALALVRGRRQRQVPGHMVPLRTAAAVAGRSIKTEAQRGVTAASVESGNGISGELALGMLV